MITMEQKRTAIEAIQAANNGKVDADLIISAARNKDNILHGLFEWSVQAAAHEHWRDTARGILREVRIEMVIENRKVTSVGYVHDPSLPNGDGGYIALTSVQRRSAEAQAIIQAEVERIIPAIRRAQEIADCLGLRRDLDALLANALALQNKIERTATKSSKVKPRDLAAKVATRRDAGSAKPRHA